MCELESSERNNGVNIRTIPVTEAVGMVLAHDITEIRKDEFKGRALKKGHIIRQEDISHLQRLGKEHLYALNIGEDEMHEDDAAYALATALMGEGVKMEGETKEGKINIIAERDGLLKINRDTLVQFNMIGDVMCATLHSNAMVKAGQIVAGTRAIPLLVKREIVKKAVEIANSVKCQARLVSRSEAGVSSVKCQGKDSGVIEVKEIRKPKVGVVITGNEVYYGRIKDAFAPVITEKIKAFDGKIVGIYYAPDDEKLIEARLKELIEAGADLLITTGGMSVDPDDVTRFAISSLGASDIAYGSAVLPGAMFLVAYIDGSNELQVTSNELRVTSKENSTNSLLKTRYSLPIPILGIPACGMYHKITIFDLILPRILAGEKIGRQELAELGHGGLCLNCKTCNYPVCPFGK